MTKADLITIIADKLKFPWTRAELLVDVVFGCLEQSMSRGEKIEIRTTRPNYPYTQTSMWKTPGLSSRLRPHMRGFLRGGPSRRGVSTDLLLLYGSAHTIPVNLDLR